MTARQQGDVRMVRVAAIPKDATVMQKSARGYVLAEGEATGHAHVVTDDVELYEHEGVFYLRTDHDVTVTHEEHHSVILPPGTWRIRKVREKDMLEGFVRPVVD